MFFEKRITAPAGEEKQKLKQGPTMPKHIFMRKKDDFVYSYIFLQLLHYDAASPLKIDPIYCTWCG